MRKAPNKLTDAEILGFATMCSLAPNDVGVTAALNTFARLVELRAQTMALEFAYENQTGIAMAGATG